MNARWGNLTMTTLLTFSVLAAVGACSTTEDPAPEAGGRATGVPHASPIKLPAFWDGMNGGIFEFSAWKPAYTADGILTIDAAKRPVIWTWDGEPTSLEPDSEGAEVEIEDSYIYGRDGAWHLTTLWRGTVKATGNTLGDAKVTLNVTTWNSMGKQLFQGPVDKLDVSLSQLSEWGIENGMLSHEVGVSEQVFGDARSVLISPLTGQISRGVAPAEDQVRGPWANNGGMNGTNPNLTVEHPTPESPWRITNTGSGAITDLPASGGCGDTTAASTVVSSFDGRYLAVGDNVVDSKSGTSTCLDDTGNPTITAIASDGVGYGTATQNGSSVVISYDFGRDEVTVLPDAMVAPTFVGPDDVAVVEPERGRQGMTGVYKVAE